MSDRAMRPRGMRARTRMVDECDILLGGWLIGRSVMVFYGRVCEIMLAGRCQMREYTFLVDTAS